MERPMRVEVFESNNIAEVQLIKAKLKNADIESYMENKYMSFTTTPTATALKLMVEIQDEKNAFEIIDQYLRETDN